MRENHTRPRLCAMVTASKTSFTEIKSLTESVLREMGLTYTLEPCDLPTFVPGRGAKVMMDGREIGIFGEMAPAVVVAYEITHPIIFMELDLEPIVAMKKDTLF